jgi:hypothetical protein
MDDATKLQKIYRKYKFFERKLRFFHAVLTPLLTKVKIRAFIWDWQFGKNVVWAGERGDLFAQ